MLTAVELVETPHVSGEQRLQNVRRRQLTDLQKPVEVIRYQDIGVARERVALVHGPKRLDEGPDSRFGLEKSSVHHCLGSSRARVVLRHELAGDAASSPSHMS